jgi:hypothetical protein
MSPRVWTRPFWKLARVAMDHLDQDLRDIAWSNLAKVAPAAGKNPTRELLWSQHRLGGALLGLEVAELDPAVVLIVSGRSYSQPFLDHAGVDASWERRGALHFSGSIAGRKWIIVNHPGTFAERYETSRAAVEAALRGD